MKLHELKKALEAFLFISSQPVQIFQMKEVLGINDSSIIEKGIDELRTKYASNDSGLRLIEVAGGFRLSTVPELAPYVKKMFKRDNQRLSRASLETLSIIAYRQPVTRSDVEAIRGVNVDGALTTLLERSLVRIVGRRETPGRPILYGTTRLFLEHFGLNTLKELPELNEYSEMDLTEEERQKIDDIPAVEGIAGNRVDNSMEQKNGEYDPAEKVEEPKKTGGQNDEKSKEIAQENRQD